MFKENKYVNVFQRGALAFFLRSLYHVSTKRRNRIDKKEIYLFIYNGHDFCSG